MDLLKIIAELKTEKQRIDDAIDALERLSANNSRSRHGRAPSSLRKDQHSREELQSEALDEEEAAIKKE